MKQNEPLPPEWWFGGFQTNGILGPFPLWVDLSLPRQRHDPETEFPNEDEDRRLR